MEKLLVLELDGSFDRGFKANLEIRQGIHSRPRARIRGTLPANPELLNLYRQWQRDYSDLESFFRALSHSDPEQVTRLSRDRTKLECQKTANSVGEKFNDWLNSSSEFEPIRTAILRASATSSRLWIQTDYVWLRRIPWEKWDVARDNHLDLAIIASEYDISAGSSRPNSRVQILAVLGGASDLESLKEDRKVLDEIAEKAGAEIHWLESPTARELTESLRQGRWDIFFFSGHSASTEDGKHCEIQLTEAEKLEIPDFQFSLREATRKGLKIAIFNSCDGVGLAHQLAAEKGMVLPHLIFMREKLPDPIAPKFLRVFLEFFTAENSLYTSVQEARKILHDDWEKEYPCASWLPVICPNPTEEIPAWNELHKHPRIRWRSLGALMAISCLVTGVLVGIRETGGFEKIDLQTYDRIMQWKPKDKPDDRFLIITIDKEDKEYQDRMGMKRPIIAGSDRKRSLAGEALSKLLHKIQPYKPSVIALDILRPIAATEDYPPLANQLKTVPNFLTICKFNNYQQSDGISPPPELALDRTGFSNVVVDENISGVPRVRRLLYQAKLDKTSPCLPPESLAPASSLSCNFKDYAPSFSLAIAKRYLELQNQDFNCNKLDRGILEINIGDTRLGDWLQSANGPYKSRQADTRSGRQVMLDYRRIAGNGGDAIVKIAPKKSLRQVLDPSFNPESVRGKIVLIGVTEPGVDDFLTPFSRDASEAVPGVYLHAHAVSQILDTMTGNRTSIAFWNPLQEAFWGLGWSLVGGGIAWRFLRVKSILIAGSIALVSLGGIGWILLSYGGLWVPIAPPALAILLTSGIFFSVRSYYLK
ncbi:CHASE2 domain-containing protein [Pannus brasiliensis]